MRRFTGNGFSLAEVLIASGILAAALVPLFLMQGTALSRVRGSRSEIFATAIAGELAEQVRLLPFAALPSAQPFKFKIDAPAGRTVTLPGASAVPMLVGKCPLDGEITIAVEPLDPPDLLARVTITVDWTEGEPKVARQHQHVELVENRLGASDAP